MKTERISYPDLKTAFLGDKEKNLDPFYKVMGRNFKREMRAPSLVVKELWETIKNPSLYLDEFKGKNLDINAEIEKDLKKTGKQKLSKIQELIIIDLYIRLKKNIT